MILCDTSPLFCLVDISQPKHLACKTVFNSLNCPLITTWSCFTEAMYLTGHRGGWLMQEKLIKLLTIGLLRFYDIRMEDYQRLFALMKKYQDRPMDFADATLVLAAENLNINRIFTFDSDFFFYLINDSDPFDVII